MFIRNTLATTVAIALSSFCSTAVLAQDDSQEVLDEVVVLASPIKDSQMAAIEAKRVSSNVMEVIAADTIGRFPDQNLADSLGRVPGLAIERDQGQARYINFRGMPFRYTAIGFDGIDVQGAENGRIPRFDSFPSVITSRVEVNKAILPSMPGEAVAGYVNIETYNPFDREGFAGDLDIGIGRQNLGKGDIEKFGTRLSFSNDTFGMMGFFSKNSRDQVTDNREYDLEPAGNSVLINELDFRSYRVKREDEARGVHIEYRADAHSRVFISNLYSEFSDFEERNQWVLAFDDAPTGPVVASTPVGVTRLLQDGYYNNSTDTTTLGADFQLSNWDIKARVNSTKTTFDTQLPIIYGAGVGAPITASIDISDITDPIVVTSQALEEQAIFDMAYLIDSPMDVDATKVKLDISKDMKFLGLVSTFSAGAEYNQREASGYNAVVFDTGALAPLGLDFSSFLTNELWHSNTTNSLQAHYYNNPSARNAWEAAKGSSLFEPAGEDEVTQIEEDILAAYAMMESQFNWGNIVYGIRVEQTDYRSVGTLLNDDGTSSSIDYKDDFTNILPSTHLNYNISDDLIARISLSTGVNRPTYSEWRAAASVNPTTNPIEVSGGNPSLKAEESVGLDASIEYYFAPASLLSASIFSRSIDNVIYTDVQNIEGGVYNPAAQGETWELSGPVNGSKGKLLGLELNILAQMDDYIPQLSGVGVSANVTFTDAEFTNLQGEKLGLPGTSDLIYNASIFYENYGFSARLNYQYRDEWISPIEDPSEVWDEQQRLDFNMMYDLPLNWQDVSTTLYFNANNLTNETDLRFAGNGTVNQSESYGARYLFGIRLNF